MLVFSPMPSAPKGSCRRIFAFAALFFTLVSGIGCSSTDPGTRWSRHFDDSIWSGALKQQVARPDRLIPEAVFAATIPLAYVYDRTVQDHTEDRSSGPLTEKTADALQVVAPFIPLSIGLIRMSEGDDGRLFEVAVESLAASVSLQQTLAWTIRRKRPDRTNDLSFYSGHTAWVFTSTTLIVRILRDPSDDAFRPLDALLYVPAVFTGWERIVDNRHWTSDVAIGAFLGVFLTNLIWDAHFGSDEESRRVIHLDDPSRGTGWTPGFDVIDGCFVVSVQAGF